MTFHARWPLLVVLALIVQAWPVWEEQASGTTERLRGVAAVDSQTAWATGNRAVVLHTADGGRHWRRLAVPGSEGLDFRDVEAFGGGIAYVLAIGSGDKSRIYKTADAGRAWTLSFANDDPNAFYDAIAFWDARTGLAVGDPIDGRFTVIRTSDGGKTWRRIDTAGMPPALSSEGAFAASGTCLVAGRGRRAWFVSGGAARARVFRSSDGGLTWQVADTPLAAGLASAGGFSVAFADERHGIVVGGDYRREPEQSDNIAITDDGGRTWAPLQPLAGFRSAVAFVPGTDGRVAIATGPAGSDWSRDGGRTWSALPGRGFHALSLSPHGDSGWGVGENGRTARLALSLASLRASAGTTLAAPRSRR